MLKVIISMSTIWIILFFLMCQTQEKREMKILQTKIGKFAPTEINYDESLLNERQVLALEKLVLAAKIMDELFLQQVYSKNMEIKSILTSSQDEADKVRLELFDIMFGPFDRLDHNKPFYSSSE